MRIDWRSDLNAPPCRVIDLDTGEQILYCVMADEETGEYERYQTSIRDGKVHFAVDDKHRLVTVNGKSRLQIVLLLPGEPYLTPSFAARSAV